jgi:hypothetical protein
MVLKYQGQSSIIKYFGVFLFLPGCRLACSIPLKPSKLLENFPGFLSIPPGVRDHEDNTSPQWIPVNVSYTGNTTFIGVDNVVRQAHHPELVVGQELYRSPSRQRRDPANCLVVPDPAYGGTWRGGGFTRLLLR